MINRLQFRLMASFVVVIAVTLVVIAGVLMLFLQSRPVPLDSLRNDLGATSLEVDFTDVFEAIRQQQNNNNGNRDNQNSNGIRLNLQAFNDLSLYLDDNISNTDYRFFVLTNANRVLYDSEGRLDINDQVMVTEEQAVNTSSTNNQRNPLFSTGIFILQDQPQASEYVFVSRRVLNNVSLGRRDASPVDIKFWVTAPRPESSLAYTVDTFSDTFFLPLVQAALIGILIATVLSIWVARSVAKPLQRIADGTRVVAQGDYSHRVPVSGVHEARVVGLAFNDMTEQVQQTHQAQNDFLANVTHELRTPLTSIQGFSQAIMDGTATDPAMIQRSATIIHDESARLTRMVSDLLDLAKIQSGHLQMRRNVVETNQLLQTIGESLQFKAQAEKVNLDVSINTFVRIAGDGDRLAQVFTNLVDNAIKHTPEGGQVWFKAEQSDNGILVTVQDTGEGIPEDDVPRIFERFYQVDKSRHRKTSHNSIGLGLAITKEIIDAHHGRIWVESQPGVGTCFSVWLPILSADRSTMIMQKPQFN